VFDNRGNFEDKLQRLINTVGQLVGLPGFERSTTKFLLAAAPTVASIRAAGLSVSEFQIEKVYLYADDGGGGTAADGAGGAEPPSPTGSSSTGSSSTGSSYDSPSKSGNRKRLVRASSINGRPHSPSIGSADGEAR